MKKDEYKKYIVPEEFAALYDEWAQQGKLLGNSKLYLKIWDGVQNAVKACIGSLQDRYHCKVQSYEDKVFTVTTKMVEKLINMNGTPRNIVNIVYLPTLGACFGREAKQSEFEDNMLSLNNVTDDGTEYIELLQS